MKTLLKTAMAAGLLGAVLMTVLTLRPAQAARPSAMENAGREAFISMKCTACHLVLGDPDLPPPIASEPAPVLGGLNAVHTVRELELAIVSPSHSSAPGFPASGSGGSRMGSMLDSFSVEQVEAIAAYLKGREDSDASWRKEGP